MRRIFSVLVMVTAAALLVGAAAGPVAAQTDGGESNATANVSASTPGDVHVVNQDLGGARLVSWQAMGDGTIRMTLASEIPTRVGITDASGLSQALSEGEGARTAEIRTRTVTVGPGAQQVDFSASVVDGSAAVTVGAGRLVALRTGSISAGSDRPPVPFMVAGGAVVLTFAGTAYTAFGAAREKYNEEDERWKKRIA